MNPLFKRIAVNDPKDLFLFLLETIHKELNKVEDVQSLTPNSNDFMSIYSNFVYTYSDKNIIRVIFFMQQRYI